MQAALYSYFRTIRLVALIGVLALSSGCVVHQSPLEEVDSADQQNEQRTLWQANKQALAEIDHWKIKGKIGVKAADKGGHATLRWDREDASEHIELFGPLGGGRVEIDADANSARLKDTKGGELEGKAVAPLIEARLGWPLPFDQLPFWLRGLPASESAELQLNLEGYVERMNDSGWQVSYPAYQSLNIGEQAISVPQKIELNVLPGTLKVYDKDGEYLGEDFFVRLIIKSWLP